jgi:hypothetical protein
VAAQHRPGVGTGREQGVPRATVDRGSTDRGRVLGERHRVTPLVGETANLLRGLLDVEVREDSTGDEPVRVRAAPLVDVPVVVGLDHHEVDLGIRPLVEHLPGEPGPVGEVEPREHPAGRHVAHALVHVVAPGAHLVVGQRVHVEELGGLAGHRIQPEIATADVAVPPLLRAVLLGHDAGHVLAVLLRDVGLEHVGRLTDVVVDTHQDHVVAAHGCSFCVCVERCHRHAQRTHEVGYGVRSRSKRRIAFARTTLRTVSSGRWPSSFCATAREWGQVPSWCG